MAARLDDDGMHLPASWQHRLDHAVDVVFDGDRVWSCVPRRDGRERGRWVHVPWPAVLRTRLRGTATVGLVAHADGTVLHEERHSFGDDPAPLSLRDAEGRALAVDKSGRLHRTFDEVDGASKRHLVEAAHRVLVDLRDVAGLDAYLAYGCLLGARRTGHVIGHDTDADLSYLSRHTHPFDIARECRAAERALRERGWSVVRMSAANFKVWVDLPDGGRTGVDVFCSFHVGEHFHVLGSLRGRLPREAILPLSTIELEGVTFPAPRDVDAWLEVAYGPGWRVPDPGFHFDHPAANRRLMDAWWRAPQRGLRAWQDLWGGRTGEGVLRGPSATARWALEQLTAEARGGEAAAAPILVDVGCGNGRDSVFFGKHGYDVRALDYASKARRATRRLAHRRGVDLTVHDVALGSPRDVLLRGAQLAHQPGVRHVYARRLVDHLPDDVRPELWRLCRMIQRTGGLTLLELGASVGGVRPGRRPLDPSALAAEMAHHGARLVAVDTLADPEPDAPDGATTLPVHRLIARWDR